MIDQIVTIIGCSFIQPICTLLENLENHECQNVGPLGSGYCVNGYSASICLLSVALLESYVMRVKYINKANEKEINKMSVWKYLQQLYEDFPYSDEVAEMFILRDTITHNHLWEIYLSRDAGNVYASEEIRRSLGDKKYENFVDYGFKRTKKLNLTVIPINVGKHEVVEVLENVWNVLLFLQGKNLNQCSVSAQHHKYRGKMRTLGEVIEIAKNDN